VQAITASGNLVYVGGHFVEYCVGGTGAGAPFVCDNPLSRGKLAAVAQSDGGIDDWNPDTNGSLGVFALAATSDGLAAGGQMTTYGLNLPSGQQVHQQGFAHFGPAGGGGDSTPPDTPTGLTAAPTGQTSIHLTWDATTDNVGVTSYQVVRDGSVVASLGNVTSYDDTGLQPGTLYSYTVRAKDAAGNTSYESDPATATTDPATSTTVFADDFESGNLAKWTHVTGAVTAQGTTTHAGSFAAEAKPAASPAWAYVSIPNQTDLTYDLWFDVRSKSSTNLNLLQLRRSSGAAILTVSLNGSTNRLRERNAVSGTTVTSTATVAANTWHHLVVHLTIAGASGHTDVSLDGAAVATLSRTWNTGANPIGRLTMGDSTSNGTADVAYDDVLAHT
jgi:Concanavalin A-like lectin/glucanases superfamily/Fibronectin type III domain